MSTDKRKINIGLLPEQSEDYSQYEESEFNWGRIISATVLVLAIVICSIYFLLKSDEAPSNNINSMGSTKQITHKSNTETPTNSTSKSTQTTLKATKPSVPKSKPQTNTVEVNIAKSDEASLVNKTAKKVKEDSQPAIKTHQKESSTQQKKPYIHQTKAVSPVKILDARIKRAQLSSNLIKGMPVDTLSSQVLMSEEGIIRVHLYTEMENLRGQNLFHHWYLNGEKQARVRVPINHNQQRSSSSKFINKQMLGKWTVQVLDEQGKAYIEVNFEVISP